MKNKINTLLVIFLSLNLMISCSDETVIDENTYLNTVINEYKLSDLPDNIEDLDKIIAKQKEELGIKSQQKEMSSRNSFPSYDLDYNFYTYQKVFVVIPKDWNQFNYNYFLSVMRIKYGDIKVEPNNCDYIETWYIPNKSTNPLLPLHDRSKNLIVASNSGLNGNTQQQEDGPQLPPPFTPIEGDYYSSCEEINL